jgi:hypothetical protein
VEHTGLIGLCRKASPHQTPLSVVGFVGALLLRYWRRIGRGPRTLLAAAGILRMLLENDAGFPAFLSGGEATRQPAATGQPPQQMENIGHT